MVKRYKSDVSYGMLIALFVLFFVPVFLGVVIYGIDAESYVAIGILVLCYGLVLNLFLGTEYRIEEDKLKIKCGLFFNKTIHVKEIKNIVKTRSLIASPAPSLDRIEIKYGKYNSIIISPKDKLNFASDLLSINADIENEIL